MIFGAILAGGVGSRMGIESMPKQFLLLGEKPIFIHTLEKFLLCPQFDAVYLGVHKDWVEFAEDAISSYIDMHDIPVRVVAGGKDRNSTIMNIVDAISADHACADDSIVVTHDSVRPFVKLSTLEENIKAALEFGACDTVVPATDTIVVSDDGRKIDSIPLRSTMYQGQTPQSFRISVLKKAYGRLEVEDLDSLTDACGMLVMQGHPVQMVLGDSSNIKLTTIADYRIAQAMVGSGAVPDDK